MALLVEPWKRHKPERKLPWLLPALAAYKHDTLGRYLPTVLYFKLQATPIPPQILSVSFN